MWKLAGFLGIGLVVGFAFASLSNRNAPGFSSADQFSASVLEERIDEIESSLAEARRERRDLEELVLALEAQLENGEPISLAGVDDSVDILPLPPQVDDAQARTTEGRRPSRFRLGDRRLNNDSLVQDFINAGIAPDRAQWIIDRTDELRMEALQERYNAARDGVSATLRSGTSVDGTLREELGDADFERYLEATGRPTDVGIGSVLASSPAEQAGLQQGDRVVAYGGERVFNMAELNRLTFEGQPGESVVVEVLRDGQPIQLVLPRGPIGITSGGNRFRR